MGEEDNGENRYRMVKQDPISWTIDGMKQENLLVERHGGSLGSALAEHARSTSELLLVNLPRSLDISSIDGAKVSIGDERPVVRLAGGDMCSAKVTRVSHKIHKCLVGPRLGVARLVALGVAPRPLSACLTLARSFPVPEVRLPAPMEEPGGVAPDKLKFRNFAFGGAAPGTSRSPRGSSGSEGEARDRDEQLCLRRPDLVVVKTEPDDVDYRLPAEVAHHRRGGKLANTVVESVGLNVASPKRSKKKSRMGERSDVCDPVAENIRLSKQEAGLLDGRRKKNIKVECSPIEDGNTFHAFEHVRGKKKIKVECSPIENGNTFDAFDNEDSADIEETMNNGEIRVGSHADLDDARNRNKKKRASRSELISDIHELDASHEGRRKSAKRKKKSSSLGQAESANAAYHFLLAEQAPGKTFHDPPGKTFHDPPDKTFHDPPGKTFHDQTFGDTSGSKISSPPVVPKKT